MNQFKIVGTFCEKCRQVMCVCEKSKKAELELKKMLMERRLNQVNWTETKQMPEYDGEYYCHIVRHNECGTFSKYKREVECSMNKWKLNDERERVTHWVKIESPTRNINLI